MMGISLLTGLTTSSSETSSPEVTSLVLSLASESKISNTLHFEQPKELLQSQSCGKTNLFRSVRRGISPNLCAIASSCITDEFSIMTTSSIANVGTSLIEILLIALTYCLGTLLNLNTMRSLVLLTTSREGV
jgi:hypothetical protein